MSGRTLGLVFAVAFLVAFLARLPLGAVLDPVRHPVLGPAVAQGTIWSGRLAGVVVNGLALGDIHLGLRPQALAAGRLGADWRLPGGGVAGRGMVSLGPDRDLIVTAADLRVGLDRLLPALPVAGTLSLDAASLTLRDGRCMAADGLARLVPHPAGPPGVPWTPPDLSGRPRCEGGVVLLPLAGEGPQGALSATVRLDPGAGWRLDIALTGIGPALAGPLTALGFRAEGARHLLTLSGPWPRPDTP